jgi:hypothetical protein
MASLARFLTPENRTVVLPRFFHRSKQEAKFIAAELMPVANPARRTVITVVPANSVNAVAGLPETTPQSVFLGEPARPEEVATSSSRAALVEPAPTLRVEPLTPTETRIHVTVSPAFLEKLEAARLALSHSMPGASEEDVLSAGLDLLLDRAGKRNGLVAKPRPAPVNPPAEPGAVYIPASVRREVWERDQRCCQWKLKAGGICGSKLRIELDHLRCRGARPIASELRLLCDWHNKLAARLALGDALMDRHTRDPRQPELPGDPANALNREAPPSCGLLPPDPGTLAPSVTGG